MSAEALRAKIEARTAAVGVIGLGYVGLPLVLEFAEAGFRVLGFDVDPEKTGALNAGRSYIHHIPTERIQQARDGGRFEATTEFARLPEVDAIIVCVPTPLDEKQAPALQFVISTAETIAAHLRPGQLVALESTTYPGTTAEVLEPRFNARGLRVGTDYFLAFSPEREDPGNSRHPMRTIPKVLGGSTPTCAEVGRALYGAIFEHVVVLSSTQAAEMTKLLENIFRSVNIALVNELKMLTSRMGIDIWEVIAAANTKPFGFMPFYPGPGLGGHCIPIDPFYLSWKAKEFDFPTRFIELAGEINTSVPYYVVGRLTDALNERERSLKGANVLVLGVAYKKDVDDMRESPAIKILELMRAKGATIAYHDPFVPRFPRLRGHDLALESVALTPDTLAASDAVIIVTDHSQVDYRMVIEHAPLVVDTRNATDGLQAPPGRVVKA